MASQTRRLRRYVDDVLAGRQHPPQRERLYAVAVHLCGLLCTLAVDLGLHTYGVDDAVDRGFTLLADFPTGEQVSASLTLGVYCPARATANAATAYLALGQPAMVQRYATTALAVFDREGLRGPQALTRLDLATAALMAPDPEPERAAQLAAEAIAVSAPQRLESVNIRAREFLDRPGPGPPSRESVRSPRWWRTRTHDPLIVRDGDGRWIHTGLAYCCRDRWGVRLSTAAEPMPPPGTVYRPASSR